MNRNSPQDAAWFSPLSHIFDKNILRNNPSMMASDSFFPYSTGRLIFLMVIKEKEILQNNLLTWLLEKARETLDKQQLVLLLFIQLYAITSNVSLFLDQLKQLPFLVLISFGNLEARLTWMDTENTFYDSEWWFCVSCLCAFPESNILLHGGSNELRTIRNAIIQPPPKAIRSQTEG